MSIAQVYHDADPHFRKILETLFCRLGAPIQGWRDGSKVRHACYTRFFSREMGPLMSRRSRGALRRLRGHSEWSGRKRQRCEHSRKFSLRVRHSRYLDLDASRAKNNQGGAGTLTTTNRCFKHSRPNILWSTSQFFLTTV